MLAVMCAAFLYLDLFVRVPVSVNAPNKYKPMGIDAISRGVYDDTSEEHDDETGEEWTE